MRPKTRRTFLAASGVVPAVAKAAQAPPSRPVILITSASHHLAAALAQRLSTDFQIRLTDRVDVSSPFEFVRGALEQDADTAALVKGVEAIVHVAEPLPDDDEKQRLDWLTRGTYNLLMAASAAGVKRVVYLNTLAVMTAYDANYTVSESWRPQPSPGAAVLSKHLGEIVCKEFARDRKIRATSLRLGTVVRSADTKGKPFDSMWVDEQDVGHAVNQAIKVMPKDNAMGIGSWWAIYHIGSDSPGARFLVSGAKYGLAYQPQVKW